MERNRTCVGLKHAWRYQPCIGNITRVKADKRATQGTQGQDIQSRTIIGNGILARNVIRREQKILECPVDLFEVTKSLLREQRSYDRFETFVSVVMIRQRSLDYPGIYRVLTYLLDYNRGRVHDENGNLISCSVEINECNHECDRVRMNRDFQYVRRGNQNSSSYS